MTTRGRDGSSFDEFLCEDGIYEEVVASAIKRVILAQLESVTLGIHLCAACAAGHTLKMELT